MPFNSYPYFVFWPWRCWGSGCWKTALTGGGCSCSGLLRLYAWWRADFLLLLCGSTLVNYALGCRSSGAACSTRIGARF